MSGVDIAPRPRPAHDLHAALFASARARALTSLAAACLDAEHACDASPRRLETLKIRAAARLALEGLLAGPPDPEVDLAAYLDRWATMQLIAANDIRAIRTKVAPLAATGELAQCIATLMTELVAMFTRHPHRNEAVCLRMTVKRRGRRILLRLSGTGFASVPVPGGGAAAAWCRAERLSAALGANLVRSMRGRVLSLEARPAVMPVRQAGKS